MRTFPGIGLWLLPCVALALSACRSKAGAPSDSAAGGGADTAAPAEGAAPGDCGDGLDNDGDGAIDCGDAGCAEAPDCAASSDDADGDGVPVGEDCDDTDPTVGAPVADDPDCDGVLTHAGGGDLLRIPAGAFEMGCTPGQADCLPDESPVTPVTLAAGLFLGVTEVTQGEYAALMGANPSNFSACGADCPVESLTWDMAAAFTNALSAAAGLTACYACAGSGEAVSCSVALAPTACDGYRLPTEAEWEAAARCGTDLRFAGSDNAAEVAWSLDNSGGATAPVAGKAPNACGLYDLSGNVWEWTQDWYGGDTYTGTPVTDPVGPGEGVGRVHRGGAYVQDESGVRVAYRGYSEPSHRGSGVGLRVARTAR